MPGLPLPTGEGRGEGGASSAYTSLISKKIPLSSSLTLGRAKELRQRQTHTEIILWSKLRDRRFYGIKFRRQVAIDPFIADFLFAEANLIIEVDGESHYKIGAKEYDERRDAYLKSKGFKVIRFTNQAVKESLDYVLEKILEAVQPSP